MTALNPRQYADAVRDLRGRLGGKPIDGHPEYAALQARLIGNAPAAGPAAPVIRDGQATIPGQFTATGYRPPLTGERARSWAGTPLGDAGQ